MKDRTLAICPRKGNRLAYLATTETGTEVWVSETVDTTKGRVAHWTRFDLDAMRDSDDLHSFRHAFCGNCNREFDWRGIDFVTYIDDLSSNPKRKPIILQPA
ncbi:hypothetical protein [Cryobacterium sp. MDB2-10]|uniref:hypothetical protein n=1 Tax=Cryobacterium sp. MDB2-10 TaxID=1259177 RepID=UPI00107480BF|nr:hypothetical protein [Cryobacterium sp. MDB2-10]TFC20188.1 hypothetical protein E3O51_05590 [Cryobacterium sp. MDB2-10]